MSAETRDIRLLYADAAGSVWDFPDIEPAFRTGKRFVKIDTEELIKLPYGSYLFSLPDRFPVFYNRRNNDFNHIEVSPEGNGITAVSAFLASAYLRTYLPAYIKKEYTSVLPMWAYTGVLFAADGFLVPGLRIDDDTRSDPLLHENDEDLKSGISVMEKAFPRNRLVKQLAKCSTIYRCLCARNFFLGRFEAPVPTTPDCNARCAGCLSLQPAGSPFESSQNRLEFRPSPEEISEVIIQHFASDSGAVASFGQGCEGEPLLRAQDLGEAIRLVREKTGAATINLNTNGSLPNGVRSLIQAGLDSIRISLNSPTREYYAAYHRPAGYCFDDVMRSMDIALNAGIYVSINLFFMPGFTDMESEVDSLRRLLKMFPVHMIQTRNLNIDPDFYFDLIGFRESEPIGIRSLVGLLREEFPDMRLGYYNPPVKP